MIKDEDVVENNLYLTHHCKLGTHNYKMLNVILEKSLTLMFIGLFSVLEPLRKGL
jgi:hypothetical protein